MNTLKSVHYSFPRTSSSHFQIQKSITKRRPIIINLANPESSDSTPSIPDGDKRKQELLAQIALLQAQKVRLTNFLDDRSAHLSKFAEEASAEFDAIGENALKELDYAGSRILEKLESQLQAFEESGENKDKDDEINDKILEELKGKIERVGNEDLFFKNLRRTPQEKAEAREEAEKLGVAKKRAGSRARRNVYLALITLMILTVGNALIGEPEVHWRKVGVLSLVILCLVVQLIYEHRMLTKDETNMEN